jgi:hypothetical protein
MNGVQEGCDYVLFEAGICFVAGGGQEKHEIIVTLASLERLNVG